MPKDRMVICEDFNIKLGPRDTDSKFQQCRAGRTLLNLVKEYDFADIWRKANPNVRKYIGTHGGGHVHFSNLGLIRYVFVSECLYRGIVIVIVVYRGLHAWLFSPRVIYISWHICLPSYEYKISVHIPTYVSTLIPKNQSYKTPKSEPIGAIDNRLKHCLHASTTRI